MQTVAFLTYNTVGTNAVSGWQDGPDGRRALVLQNSNRREVFAVFQTEGGRVHTEINRLWALLSEQLPTLDAVVIYVGTNGSERAIELAKTLDPSKVMFVLCDCDWGFKTNLIERSGLKDARRIMCECRGVSTMGNLLKTFLATGELG